MKVLKNISFLEAMALIEEAEIKPLGKEKIVFSDSLNRVLAQDIIAEHNMPKSCTSAMDGYAFNYDDFEKLKGEGLEILGDNPAGAEKLMCLNSQSTIKTFTGSVMPLNSDTILIVEHAKIFRNRLFLDLQAPVPKRGDWVRKIGENYSEGDVLLKVGTRIGMYEIGLFAELNKVFVQVVRRPRVGIFSGGSEIIEVGEEKQSVNAIYSANNHILKAMVEVLGGEGVLYPLMPDNTKVIEKMLLAGFKDCDLLLSTGGMSKGDYDFTQQIISKICCIVFQGVRIKPGKPLAYATYKTNDCQKYLLGLPGFPNSAVIGFYFFGSILISKMLGIKHKHKTLKATLKEKITRIDSRMEFRACDLDIIDGRYEVSFFHKRTLQSSVINNLCGESALLVLEENGDDLEVGEEVNIILFRNFF